jgi:hypothetical protein
MISEELKKKVDPNNECCCEHSLAHKCKEWAYGLHFNILIEKLSDNGYFGYVVKDNESIENYGYIQEIKVIFDTIHNSNEIECIFKACQWILDNKDIR